MFFLFLVSLSFGMKAFMDITEVWIGDVSVNLGGGDVGVAKERLNGT